MLLMPKKDWQWKYNDALSVLNLSLGSEMEFLTPYTKRKIIPDAFFEVQFCVDHARFYIDMLEKLPKSIMVSDAALVQIALNATAAHFMLQSQMPKSWYYKQSTTCVYSEIGKVFELRAEFNDSKILSLVVDSSIQVTTLMVLSIKCDIAENKCLKQFDVIKVMNDRLFPLLNKKQTAVA